MAKSLSARFGLQRWSADGDTQSRAEFDDAHALLDDLAALDMQGLFADRPAADTDNRGLYYAVIDTGHANDGKVYRSTGSAWAELITATSGAAAFQPLNASLWLPAREFIATVGSPSISIVGTVSDPWPAWHFDAAIEERVASTVIIPPGWSNVQPDVYWTNPGAGAGDVRFRTIVASVADGSDLTPGSSTNVATFPAPSLEVLKVSSGSTRAVAAGDVTTVTVGRVADDGTDTLPNDAAVIGVRLRKVA